MAKWLGYLNLRSYGSRGWRLKSAIFTLPRWLDGFPGRGTAFPVAERHSRLRNGIPGCGTAFPVAERHSRSRNDVPGRWTPFPHRRTRFPPVFAGVPGQITQLPGLVSAVPGQITCLPGLGSVVPGRPDTVPVSPDGVPAWLEAVPGQNDGLSRFADAVPAWPELVPASSDTVPGAAGAVAARWSSDPDAYPRLVIGRIWFVYCAAGNEGFLESAFCKIVSVPCAGAAAGRWRQGNSKAVRRRVPARCGGFPPSSAWRRFHFLIQFSPGSFPHLPARDAKLVEEFQFAPELRAGNFAAQKPAVF